MPSAAMAEGGSGATSFAAGTHFDGGSSGSMMHAFPDSLSPFEYSKPSNAALLGAMGRSQSYMPQQTGLNAGFGQGSDRSSQGSSTAKSSSNAPHPPFWVELEAPEAGRVGGDASMSELSSVSTCVEPDHRELIRSVGTVLSRRVRDNEQVDAKITLPLFMEDTHTEPEPEELYDVVMPHLHLQTVAFPTLFTLHQRPPPAPEPRDYPVPSAEEIATFLENIREKAHLTPQALVITLIYVDRLEAKSEGVLLHARSWRPIVFASILLASKVWHDISYWNSDFCSICPMFHTRNINRMEVCYLQLLKYNVLVSASQYASYYFSLRHTVRVPELTAGAIANSVFPAADAVSKDGGGRGQWSGATAVASTSPSSNGSPRPVGHSSSTNFRSKYLMAVNVPAPGWLQQGPDDDAMTSQSLSQGRRTGRRSEGGDGSGSGDDGSGGGDRAGGGDESDRRNNAMSHRPAHSGRQRSNSEDSPKKRGPSGMPAGFNLHDGSGSLPPDPGHSRPGAPHQNKRLSALRREALMDFQSSSL